MRSFVVMGLLFMGWGYYALSGGSDFVPERRENRTIFDTAPANAPVSTAQTLSQAEAEAAGDAARAEALAAVTAEPATAQTVAAPVFTSVAERRESLAALAAAQAAERAETTLRPAASATNDLRVVDGSRVNLRDGPGTEFTAIDQLTQGTITEVMEYGPGNWVRVQVQGTTQSGWMSSNFLVTVN